MEVTPGSNSLGFGSQEVTIKLETLSGLRMHFGPELQKAYNLAQALFSPKKLAQKMRKYSKFATK